MADVDHIFIGTGAPSTTPTGLGHHYVDTTTKNVYISAGTASSTDWIQVNNTGGGGSGGFYIPSSRVESETFLGSTGATTQLTSDKDLYPVRINFNATAQTWTIKLPDLSSDALAMPIFFLQVDTQVVNQAPGTITVQNFDGTPNTDNNFADMLTTIAGATGTNMRFQIYRHPSQSASSAWRLEQIGTDFS